MASWDGRICRVWSCGTRPHC